MVQYSRQGQLQLSEPPPLPLFLFFPNRFGFILFLAFFINLSEKGKISIIARFKILAYCGPDWLILKDLHPDWFNWNTTRIFHYRLMSIEDRIVCTNMWICSNKPVLCNNYARHEMVVFTGHIPRLLISHMLHCITSMCSNFL